VNLPENLTEAQIYGHVRKLLNDHERMLADGARNAAFYRALKKRVRAGSVVLDIGAGSGIWAIAAAQLGAKTVVAVESNELLLGLIKQLARDCGVGDRVQPVLGYSTALDLPRLFDVVVSETIGFDGFDESIIAIMADARRRFLKPGGALIPESVAIVAAPIYFKPSHTRLPDKTALNFAHFEALNRNAPLHLQKRTDMRLLSSPQRLIDADLYTAEEGFDLSRLQGKWSIAAGAPINAFAAWVECKLAPGVRLSTRSTTSWTPVIYRIAAIPVDATEISLKLAFRPTTAHWEVSAGAGKTQTQQSASPERATQRLLRDLRASNIQISPSGQQLLDALLAAPANNRGTDTTTVGATPDALNDRSIYPG